MYFAIKFNNLDYTDFTALKEKTVFNALKISPPLATFGENIYSASTSENRGCFLFEYHNDQKPAVSFIILAGGKSVFYHFTSSTSPQSVQSLLRGNITKFCLQEQGYFCLHASAMCIDDKVILFVGKKGAGKSTLATYFHLQGHPIWCDDYAMLQQENSCFFSFQGETALKINPDVASTLTISQKNLEHVFELPYEWKRTPQSDSITQKLYFKQQTSDVTDHPRKVAAIFFIKQRVPEPEKLITAIKKTDAFSVLMEEILLPGVNSKEYLKIYFQSAMNLLETVPSYAIHSPDNIMRIHEVYDSILETINLTSDETSI